MPMHTYTLILLDNTIICLYKHHHHHHQPPHPPFWSCLGSIITVFRKYYISIREYQKVVPLSEIIDVSLSGAICKSTMWLPHLDNNLSGVNWLNKFLVSLAVEVSILLEIYSSTWHFIIIYCHFITRLTGALKLLNPHIKPNYFFFLPNQE